MEDCKQKPNDCGVAKTLKVIGSKWTMMIIHNIFEGNNRFGSLQRALPGISPKTLSQRLQELEQEKIISKKVFAEVPLHVEYNLTEKGKSLGSIFESLSQWGKQT